MRCWKEGLLNQWEVATPDVDWGGLLTACTFCVFDEAQLSCVLFLMLRLKTKWPVILPAKTGLLGKSSNYNPGQAS